MEELKLTVYNEFVHEQKNDFVKKIYPKGMHEAIAEYMREEPGFHVTTATLKMPEHGLTEEVLDSTDVLMWWGHIAHDKGRIFYFRPGHETYPIFHNTEVLNVLANGVRWAKFSGNTETKSIGGCFLIKDPLETLGRKDNFNGKKE